MTKLKVLYIAPGFPNESRTAAEVRSNQIVERLSAKVDLHVVGFSERPARLAQIGSAHTPVSRSTWSERLLQIARRPLTPLPMARFSSPAARSTIEQVARAFDPDIVHIDTFALAGYAPNLLRYPTILHVHDAISPKYIDWASAAERPLKRMGLRLQGMLTSRYERLHFPNARFVVVDSSRDAALLSGLPGVQAKVVPLGFDGDQYSIEGHRATLDGPSIVFSGSMSSVQSVDGAERLVRDIMPFVWKRVPNAQVHLVGSNPASRIIALASGDTRVHVPGFVDDLGSYLRGADVYACPLYVGSGMRTRLVEALACGCPAVATENATRGLEVPAAGAPWISADAPDQFAAAVVKLLSDPGHSSTMGQLAAEYALARYSWEAAVDALYGVYQEALISDALGTPAK